MRATEQPPVSSPPMGGKPGSVQAVVMQAIRDLVASGRLPYAASIGRLVDRDPAQVSRTLQELLRRGRVVRGERVGSIVPYYLSERGGENGPVGGGVFPGGGQ